MSKQYYTVANLCPGNSLGYLIKRIGSVMGQIAETAFEDEPISFTQWIVLINLQGQAPMSATELSAEIGHDMGALTRVVDGLEHAGYVKRERGRDDRRTVEISLTAAGRRQMESSKRQVVELLNLLVEPFSHSETEALIGQMQRLLTRLLDHVGSPPDPKLTATAVAGARRKMQ
jgi:DNA-binding MarR family transcriptional regulator